MDSAIPYFAIYTFFWLIFSLRLLEYYVTYLRLTQDVPSCHCSPPPGKILGSSHFTYNVQPLLKWEHAAISYIGHDKPSASYCWLHMHQGIALCYVNCTCGNRLQHILNGWKSFPVMCLHRLILSWLSVRLISGWKMTLEFYHYKLRVLLCCCMLGMKMKLGKQFKILCEQCIKMV